jgi:ATP-dependent Clp protease ATP-binding subunit ClpA
MFERFTPPARRVVVLAQDTARSMGHTNIKPEHLLIGLQQGEGMAANAMAQAGVDGEGLRRRVADLYESKSAARKIDRVPFSAEAKKCLEQSLRAAVALGHNYIGTEHLFFGVQRQAEQNNGCFDELLGVEGTEINHRLTEMLGDATSATPSRSPALQSVLDSARHQAGQLPMTTGHVLTAMLADPDTQVSHALTNMGIDFRRIRAALDEVNLAETNDAHPAPQTVAITIGETTTVISDPDVAAMLQHLDSEQLRVVIKRALENPETDQPPG